LILIGPYPVLKRLFPVVLSIKYISSICTFLTVYGREQLKFLHFIYVTNYGLMMAYVKPNFVAQIKRKKRSLVVYDTTL